MSRPKPSTDRLKILFQTRGILDPALLAQELGVSKATLVRMLAAMDPAPIRIGKTNQTRYVLPLGVPGLENELPVFRIDEKGGINPESRLLLGHQQTYVFLPQENVFSGHYPPEIADLIPQGFLGRAYAKRHSQDLRISDRPGDWSPEAVMIALSKRGEDLPGNLVIGEESATRFLQLSYPEVNRSRYVELAKASLLGQVAGSSAGGEQPKFTVFRNGRHYLVKYAGMDASPGQERMRDLLICEFLALEVLSENGISTAKTSLHFEDDWVFLESERFDRIGEKGRKSVLTLAAVDDFHYGKRDQWSLAADRLQKSRFIEASDARLMKVLDAFGLWIANSDRHFHNLVFWSESTDPKKPKLRVAPAFDQLPMLYMPIAGQVLEREYVLPVPSAAMIEVWEEAKS